MSSIAISSFVFACVFGVQCSACSSMPFCLGIIWMLTRKMP
jgi:hypothetical protein